MKDKFIKWLYIIGSMFLLIPIIFVGVNVKANDLPYYTVGHFWTLNFLLDKDDTIVVNKHDRIINYYAVEVFDEDNLGDYTKNLSFITDLTTSGSHVRLFPNNRLVFNFYDLSNNSWVFPFDFTYIAFNPNEIEIYYNDTLFYTTGYGNLDHYKLYAYDEYILALNERFESGMLESNANLVSYYENYIRQLNAEIMYYSSLVDAETNARLVELAQQKQYYEDLLRTEKITAYDHGFNAGQTAEFDGSNWLVNTFLFVGTLFNLELIPGVKIGYIALIPISIAIVRYVLGIFGGKV